MTVHLKGPARDRFKADLRAHREAFSLNDAEYADQILKVSLNTYKKCVAPGKAPLLLKRHTFVTLLSNAQLDVKSYGLAVGLPTRGSPFGGYRSSDYDFLCGRFFLYRRSFLTARHITRSIMEIFPSKLQECLSFHELHYYTSETGVREERHYSGDIYLNRERTILSLPAHLEGQVRLTLLHMPEMADGKERIKMRGALLAFGIPKGYWQPTISCVFLERIREKTVGDLKNLCGTILSDSSEYSELSAELAHTEEHATIVTPLMWFKARSRPDGTAT